MEEDKGIQDAQGSHKTNTQLWMNWEGNLCHYGVLMEDGLDDQDLILGNVRFFSIRSRVYASSGKHLTCYSKRPGRRADNSPTYIANFVLS